jgi:tetratricopeptide (TPR) repeat protein
MQRLPRPSNRTLKRVGALAIVLVAVAAAVAFLALRSRPLFAQYRAERALARSRSRLDARDFAGARAALAEAIRLQPMAAEPRKRLVALERSVGNDDLAFLALQNLTEMHPEDPEAWIGLAGLMMKSGLLEAPEAALDAAIDLNPDRGDARLLRGKIRFRLGRYAGALQDARTAVAAYPTDVPSRVLLVQSSARAVGVAPAVEALREALTIVPPIKALLAMKVQLELARSDPAAVASEVLGPAPAPPRRSRPDASSDRGSLGAWTREQWPGRLGEMRRSLDAAIQAGNWDEAKRIVDTSAKDAPATAFPSYLSGVLALAQGYVDLAERHFQESLAIGPRMPAVLGALGKTWSRRGGAAYTAHQLMALAERDPGSPLVRYMAARAFIEAGDPPRAEGALRRGLELQRDSPVPYRHLTDYYFGLDRAQEALDICRQGLARFPTDSPLQMMLPQIDASVGQRAAAIEAYRGVLARRPDLDLAQYKLTTLLSTDPAARPAFLAALQPLQGDRPSDPYLLDALGWMNHQAGDDGRALPLLQRATELAPEEPSFHYHLAIVYRASGETARARESLQAALDSPRPFAERLEALRLVRQDETTGNAPSGGRR